MRFVLLSGNERMMRGRQIFSLKKDHVLKHMKEGMDIIPIKNRNENDFTVHGQHSLKVSARNGQSGFQYKSACCGENSLLEPTQYCEAQQL